MTNAELIQKIRSEIERRKKSLRAGICNEVFTRKQQNEMLVASEELDRLNRLLSTLEVEEPVCEELEKEIERIIECEKNFMNFQIKSQLIGYIARHFAQWGSEHLATSGKTSGGSSEIPNCLNELADYARRQVEELLSVIKKYDDYSEEQIEELRTHLMAMFLEGAGWQKEKMMKEAVEHYVIGEIAGSPVGPAIVHYDDNLTIGDKVRVIIIPNTDEK